MQTFMWLFPNVLKCYVTKQTTSACNIWTKSLYVKIKKLNFLLNVFIRKFNECFKVGLTQSDLCFTKFISSLLKVWRVDWKGERLDNVNGRNPKCSNEPWPGSSVG